MRRRGGEREPKSSAQKQGDRWNLNYRQSIILWLNTFWWVSLFSSVRQVFAETDNRHRHFSHSPTIDVNIHTQANRTRTFIVFSMCYITIVQSVRSLLRARRANRREAIGFWFWFGCFCSFTMTTRRSAKPEFGLVLRKQPQKPLNFKRQFD